MNENLNNLWGLIRTSFEDWNKNNAAQLAAAIAYYTIFSLSPLILIALAVAGQFYNQEAARAQLLAQISGVMGPDTASFVGLLLKNSARASTNIFVSLISFIILLSGASGVFTNIQFALNKIWEVPPLPKQRLIDTIKNRFVSFIMVLAIGVLLLFFLIVSAVISSLSSRVNGGGQNAWLPQVLNLLVLFALMTLLFAMVFRIVPDKEITWGDVWLGAAVTSLLFIIGRYGISLYLLFSRSASAYGAAGSLIILLIWIYYSAQIFLLGAEFTKVYARKFGSRKHLHEKTKPIPESPNLSTENLPQQKA